MARDIFTPVLEGERQERLLAYAEFLAARDGTPDLEGRTLSRREEAIQRFLSPKIYYQGPMDAALFAEQYQRFDPRRSTPEALLLLLTFLKINASEAYGVEEILVNRQATGLSKRQEATGLSTAGIEIFTVLEEFYHTRILCSAGRHFGISTALPFKPSVPLQALVSAIVKLPALFTVPLTLDAEILGVIAFQRLLPVIGRVFRDNPALRDALEERVIEVLVDEIGHISYNRLLLTPRRLELARALLPAVALGQGGFLPEATILGVFPIPWGEVFSFELKSLPQEVRRQAFLA
jgi:hypothetical protein